MNKIILSGRLTKDPEVRYSGEMAIASISVAVDRKIKRDGQPTADFFNCTAFGKTAQFLEKWFKKGMGIILCGNLQNDSYEKDGQKRTVTKIIIEECEFKESKSASNGTTAETSQKADSDGFMQIPDGLSDELPFN